MISAQTAIWLIFSSLILLQVKHFACDFALQTQWQIQAKGHYGRYPGFVHAGLHAITSIPALLVLTHVPHVIALVVVIEFLVHYHIDFTKARVDKALDLGNTSLGYWIIFGLDQLAHQMTYLTIVYLLLPR